jgi:hypothetical protein
LRCSSGVVGPVRGHVAFCTGTAGDLDGAGTAAEYSYAAADAGQGGEDGQGGQGGEGHTKRGWAGHQQHHQAYHWRPGGRSFSRSGKRGP